MKPVPKGGLGEIAITKELMRQGLTVFAEVGNGSRVDAVAMDKAGVLKKLQCKCTSSTKGQAVLNLRKNTLNPKYNYHYRPDDVDVFALYVEDWDVVAFVPAALIFKDKDQRSSMLLRRRADGASGSTINWIEDYLIFP